MTSPSADLVSEAWTHDYQLRTLTPLDRYLCAPGPDSGAGVQLRCTPSDLGSAAKYSGFVKQRRSIARVGCWLRGGTRPYDCGPDVDEDERGEVVAQDVLVCADDGWKHWRASGLPGRTRGVTRSLGNVRRGATCLHGTCGPPSRLEGSRSVRQEFVGERDADTPWVLCRLRRGIVSDMLLS